MKADVSGRLKGSVPVTEKNADALTEVVSNDEIQIVIAVEIPGCYAFRLALDGIVHPLLKSAVAIAKQDANLRAAHIRCHGDVKFAVAVEVTHRDRYRIHGRSNREIATRLEIL